jgi:hypothetical protein|tara:strand:- start:1395 stop:1508 length:114 start_codon:yes stop_codon:yes gene_type:complete
MIAGKPTALFKHIQDVLQLDNCRGGQVQAGEQAANTN